MSARALYYRICDGCGITSTQTRLPGRSLIEAKRKGWTRVPGLYRSSGRDYCPNCSQTAKTSITDTEKDAA